MSPRELRGSRYLTANNADLKDIILRDLPFLDFEATLKLYEGLDPYLADIDRALLNANDRYYLLTATLHRHDAWHPWLFNRCREVESNPDGYLDLWARYHYKSSIGTFGGVMQEIICDPEITIGILSCTSDIAGPFLEQLQQEMETNEDLKRIHPDVFWQRPRIEAPKWNRKDGLIVKRRGNPKEATIEAHGLIDAMPTGRHFKLLVYDDLVTERLVTNPEMIKKVTERWELSDNLGTSGRTRKWHFGTRYCSIGSSRVLMGDWSHRRIEDIRIGDTVIGWRMENGKRVLRPARVVNRGIHFQQPVNTYRMDNGRSVTCTEDHKWWRGPHGGGPEYAPLGLPKGKRRNRRPKGHRAPGRLTHLRELLVPLERMDSRDAGWLAGFFDGEGTVGKNKNHPSGIISVVQTMHNPGVIAETRRVLQALGFDYREAWHSPSTGSVHPSKPHLNMAEWKDRCTFTINGGWRERYRFLAQISPTRRDKIAATLFGQLMTTKVKLLSVEPAGDQDVHWLETETGNYVIEGFCSSNSFGDTYGVLLERNVLKERRYPATDDGTLKGKPVFLTQERWDDVKLAQKSTVNAQMLLDPIAGNSSTFDSLTFRHYDMIPLVLNVYIMCDPSKGSTRRSDRSAISVIGIDPAGNKYLLDGYCHRMKLSQRYQYIKQLEDKWRNHPGVQLCRVGYEQYGMQTDLETIEETMAREGHHFQIEELNTTRDNRFSKSDRIERLEPEMRRGAFYLPAVVHHADFGGGYNNQALWDVWAQSDFDRMKDAGVPATQNHPVGTIVYRPMQGPTRNIRYLDATAQRHRIVTALRRKDENGDLYDVTRSFLEEARLHPFGSHDDFLDATSRIYDMEPRAPVQFEALRGEMPIHPDS